MNTNIKQLTISLLAIIGMFQVFAWVLNGIERIDILLDEDSRYEILEERHESYANSAYSLGRLWGKINAESYEVNNEEIFKITGTYQEAAAIMLDNRLEDFYCWGADDCSELPTNELLLERYTVDRRTGNMPIYAFRSGFIDSFVEYMDLAQ